MITSRFVKEDFDECPKCGSKKIRIELCVEKFFWRIHYGAKMSCLKCGLSSGWSGWEKEKEEALTIAGMQQVSEYIEYKDKKSVRIDNLVSALIDKLKELQN